MSLLLVTAPATEPVSLDEAREHLRMLDDDVFDDVYIGALIKAARRDVEHFLQRALITQTWDLYLDELCGGQIILPYPPLQSVTSLSYKATDYGSTAVYTDWAATNYVVDTVSQPGRIALAYGIIWPVIYREVQAVKVRFVAGYGDAESVPEHIKQAILLKIGDLYEHRGGDENKIDIAAVGNPVDRAIESLLYSDRIMSI
jgi:uncharacterized phiE125 gp8 family phage protein